MPEIEFIEQTYPPRNSRFVIYNYSIFFQYLITIKQILEQYSYPPSYPFKTENSIEIYHFLSSTEETEELKYSVPLSNAFLSIRQNIDTMERDNSIMTENVSDMCDMQRGSCQEL